MSNAFDVKDFRRALGQFPTGVTVITTMAKGEPVGVTASSFNSVSVDPPLVLWSVDKGAYSAAIFEQAQHFAVNVLNKDQVDVSNRFAGRGEDKFAGVNYRSGVGESPLLENCAAQFECKTWNVYEGGDHLIIVGEVLDYRHGGANAPLVFSQGSYAVSMQHPASMKREQSQPRSDGFLGDYLPYLLYMAYTRSSARLYMQFSEECDITSEEWRVFTLLSDNGAIAESDLAHMVMQPEAIFKGTTERMVSKGYVYYQGSDLDLTDEGRVMGERLSAMAKEHEKAVLSELPEDAQSALKESLKIVGGFSE